MRTQLMMITPLVLYEVESEQTMRRNTYLVREHLDLELLVREHAPREVVAQRRQRQLGGCGEVHGDGGEELGEEDEAVRREIR